MTAAAVWAVLGVPGAPEDINLELVEDARELADTFGGEVTVVAMGRDPRAREEWAEHGADRAVLIAHARLEEPVPEYHTAALAELAAIAAPVLVLLPASEDGHTIAGRLAARLGTAAVVDCLRARIVDGGFEATRQVPATLQQVTVRLEQKPWVAALRAGAGLGAPRPATLREVDVFPPELDNVRAPRVVELIAADTRTLAIEQAERVVAVGAGLGDADGVEAARSLADELDAVLAGTRVVIDRGLLPSPLQIGQSGARIKPRLYVGLGVSGAPQHLYGMRDAQHIVAVNVDRNCALFESAELAVVGDGREIARALAAELRQRRSV